jgi:3-methyladenine DNA glycosylase AlkD
MGAGAAILGRNVTGSTGKRGVDAKALASSIDAKLRQRGKAARRNATETYFPSSLENLGVAVAEMRAVVREARSALKGADPAAALRLARAVVAQGTLEGRQAAYEILAGHPGALETATARDIETLGRGIDNWASVDGFACFVAGPAWRNARVSDRDVIRWARSRDRWWRRAAVVATVPLNLKSRGGTGDRRRTLMILDEVADDRDPMVAKAVSWALRTLISHDRNAVGRYLRTHGAKLPAVVKREVANKLRTGKKNP